MTEANRQKELTRPVICIRDLFAEPPETKIVELDDEGTRDWVSVTDAHGLLESAKSHIMTRLEKIKESPLARIQESIIDDLFSKLQAVVSRELDQTQLGLSLLGLLIMIDALLRFTCIAVTNEEWELHVSAFREAASQGQFKITVGDWSSTFLAAKGRRPTPSNQKLYGKLDRIMESFKREHGLELSGADAVKVYERELERRLPFTERNRIIISYNTRNRRKRKRASR